MSDILQTTKESVKSSSVLKKSLGLVQKKLQAKDSTNNNGSLLSQAKPLSIQPLLIQPKLTIGQPNDKYEQEADQVAEKVMSMPDPKVQRQEEPDEDEEMVQSKPLAGQITPLVQRQDVPEEDEEETIQSKSLGGQISPLVQRQEEDEEPQEDEETVQSKSLDGQATPLVQRQEEDEEEEGAIQAKLIDNHPIQCQEKPEEEEEPVQTKANPSQTPEVTPSVESKINAMRGSGQPLDTQTRAFMEPRFGRDFSQVRVHNDKTAAESSKNLNARAYTVGKNIVFGAGEYKPSTTTGKQLLAHELTHVGQQKDSKFKDNNVAYKNITMIRHDTNPGVMQIRYKLTNQYIARAIKSIPPQFDKIANGWLRIKIDGKTEQSLPEYTKVNHISSTKKRYKFKIMEGSHQNKFAEVKKIKNGLSTLVPPVPAKSAIAIWVNILDKGKRGELYYDNKGPIKIYTNPFDQPPVGVYNLEIPDFPHDLGKPYLKHSKYSYSWFKLSGTRANYLHLGKISEGCVTVEPKYWNSIYQHLIRSRSDSKTVGTIFIAHEF